MITGHIDVGGLSLDSISSLVELVRERAFPEVDYERRQVKVLIEQPAPTAVPEPGELSENDLIVLRGVQAACGEAGASAVLSMLRVKDTVAEVEQHALDYGTMLVLDSGNAS
jgi:hypothetical protein